MEFVSQQNTQKMNDSSKEQVGFCGKDIGGFAVLNAESIFEHIDGAFHDGAALVDFSKLISIAGNAGVQAKVLMWIGVDYPPAF